MEVIYLGTKITREQWLNRGIEQLKPLFVEAGYSIPDNYMISCGWPSREIKRAIGQCFDPELTENGTCHLFVSPVLEDPVRILDVIIHEVCHHVVGVKEKHGRKFIKLIRALGLDGKPTATFAGSELKEKLVLIADKLGPYPPPGHKITRGRQTESSFKKIEVSIPGSGRL